MIRRMVHLHRKRRNSGLLPNGRCWETYVSLVGPIRLTIFCILQIFSQENIWLVLYISVCCDMFHVFYPCGIIIHTFDKCYTCSLNYVTFIVFVAVSLPGELAKYDMLHEAIVHKCIKQVKTVEFENQPYQKHETCRRNFHWKFNLCYMYLCLHQFFFF